MNKEDDIPPESEGSAEDFSAVSQLDGDEDLTVDGRAIDDAIEEAKSSIIASQHHSLKHHLLGPSLTKAGQTGVDQKRVADIIYEASKGSKFFNNEEVKDKNLTVKIDRILKLKTQLEKLDLKHDLRRADTYITELEISRDLGQYVVHIDCDAFYAAVEEIDRPELKTVPMAVGQGVLTTCNYEARKYGCRSAMAGFVAMKLCPHLICLPLNFDKYTAKAKEVRAILAEYDPSFESSSIDEAYLNITQYCETHEMSPDAAVTQLRSEVQQKCKITISAGIAPNAKIAKICSNKNKPNGQYRLPNDRAAVMSFMRELPVRKVNGVGRVLERELDAIGVKTCGDIYEHRAYLTRFFGEKTSQFLLQTYLGLGRTDVHPADDYERKSVGTESTFRDLSSKAELRSKLRHTAEELEKDMKRVGVKGRTLCLKIKLHTYEVFTRQISPPKAVLLADDLYNYALPMLSKLEKEMPDMKLRLMGLRCTHLVSTKKADVETFFTRRPAISSHVPKDREDEWEVWPDEEFEEAARQEREEDFQQMVRMSQEYKDDCLVEELAPTVRGRINNGPNDKEIQDRFSTADWHEPFGRYKYGSAQPTPDKPPLTSSTANQNTWDCPICGTAQQADDRIFNEHIDSCLNRSAIKNIVACGETAATDDTTKSRSSSPGPSTLKRKATSSTENNGKQRKLFFT